MTRAAVCLVALSAFVLSGCAYLGVGCEVADEIAFVPFEAPQPFPCHLFSGDCCPDKNSDGFVLCGDIFDAFTYPCGGDGHGGCFCFEEGEESISSERRAAATYGLPPFDFDLGLPFAGQSTVHRLTFDLVPDSWQTFSGAVTYADGFGFNGFTALGPAGTAIGSYGVDFDANGTVDLALPLRAFDADTAFVDVDLNGLATAVDPTVQHAANVPGPGQHTFNLLLPAGGDAAPNITRGPVALHVRVVLAAGVLQNPASPGFYDVSGTFTSVDPDTGGASNGTGPNPFSLVVPPVTVAITPNPLELLDHFLCYKTKPSKGNVCAATAAANAGGLCVTDAECGGTLGACVKNKFPKGVQAALADRYGAFTPRTADVAKATRLCTPADKNGEGRNDVVTHLRAYAAKDAKGSPKRTASTPLRIVNQLGTLAVQIKAPDTLLEPAAKALGAPAPVLGAHVVDRYQCYKAKALTKRCSEDPARACKKDVDCGADGPCLGKFPKGVQVTLVDQFTGGKRFDVVKPTRLCTPALANGDPLQSPAGHLMCYKVKPAAGEPKHTPVVQTIHTTSAVGRERLDALAEDELCVPSLELTTVISG